MNKTTLPTYSDIIASRPWWCKDCDTWHTEHLWFYQKGKRATYTTCDSDGDHENCSAADARVFLRNEHKEWQEYNQWCAEHGTDPLGQFYVTYEDKTDEKWSVTLCPWIGQNRYGMKIVSATGPSGTINPADFPKHVREYTQRKRVKGIWVCPDIKSNQEAKEAGLKRSGINWVHTQTLTRKTPRSKANIAAQIREIAGRKS